MSTNVFKQPRKKISLNGSWELQPGGKESLPSKWDYEVQVPALVDCVKPKYNWQTYDYHWYRKTFRLDEVSQYQIAVLIIEQAMFGTEIWLNGKHIGGDIACYTSQEYICTDALLYGKENELLVRVGSRNTLPPASAVGKDQERETFIPGIWGDVHINLSGSLRVKLVQVISHIDSHKAEVKITIENCLASNKEVKIVGKIWEKKSKIQSSNIIATEVTVSANSEANVTLLISIDYMQLWSLEYPFLYEVEIAIEDGGEVVDQTFTTFGMREFKITGSDFYLNGKRIFLRGGNIAFHRFLSDPDRGLLPWNSEWIKKILVDIPKAHNFNFFRNHLGQMYNRWYDIADEYGILIQNEWQFWTTSGTKEQITKEFTRWLQDNWNHPSVIFWDPINESTDDVVQKEIVPKMKELDPTRAWESVDFIEQHPYIYSLGPVLNDCKFGFTVSLEEIEHSVTPPVVNEFLWWWLDKNFQPTSLTKDVIERWLGKDYTQEELISHQSFLAQELVELFRRMRVRAIQPFVYLSNNDGPTGHWFAGNIKDLQPKPVLETLKNAFSPFGLSLELWDRHFFINEERTIRLFIFNDTNEKQKGQILYGITDGEGKCLWKKNEDVSVDGSTCMEHPIVFRMPSEPGTFYIRSELFVGDKNIQIAFSQKIAHVFDPPQASAQMRRITVGLLEANGEISDFLSMMKIPHIVFHGNFSKFKTLVVDRSSLQDKTYKLLLNEITEFIKSGGTLIINEPEYGVNAKVIVTVARGLELTIEKRSDTDRGGYDSYLFAEDHSHHLWKNILKEHLKMFNGGYGGEVVSQHDVTADGVSKVFARCGLKLKTSVVFEIPIGKGKVIVSRLQLRGRLVNKSNSSRLFDRRVDPVIQQYLLNLFEYANS
ncbi:MAG: glycoside hydrolase family 2 TIM barrel-domain containing protein [Bacteroidota bacterium]|nr:glycoside hydrolase family 2 TIM barrel-domain containing protein [Bacteroidota bacterium]